MNGFLIFLIVIIFLVGGAYGGWVAYSRLRASRNGLPPPSLNPIAAFRGSSGGSNSANYPGPAPTGIKGWIDAQVHKFKNRNNRYAAGAYESSSGGGAGAGGFGAGGRPRGAGNRLDPDEAWDARVGNEAYYEEQELGLHEPAGHAGAGGYSHAAGGSATSNPFENTAYEPERGRSRNREYDESAAPLHHGGGAAGQNPFGDDHAASLRGVSPRPLDHGVDTSYGGAHELPTEHAGKNHHSPTEGSRKSLFHEEM